MQVEDFTVEVRDKNLVRQGIIPQKDLDITLQPRHNDVGEWWITLPAEHHMVEKLREPGAGVIITIGDRVMSGPVIGDNHRTYRSDPQGKVVFNGYTDTVILDHRICYPDPTSPITAQTKDGDRRSAIREDLMHEFVNVNIGPAALPDRRDTRLTLAPSGGRGSLTIRTARFETVLEMCQRICSTTTLGFDVVQVGSGLQFQTYQARDRRKSIRLDVENSTLSEDEKGVYAPSASRVVVAGKGEGKERMLTERTSANTTWVENTFGRIERFLDQRSTDDTDELQEAGDEYLADESYTGITIRVVPTDDSGMNFGKDWWLGDRVTVVIGDDEFEDRVTGALIRVDAENGVEVGVQIGLSEARRFGAKDIEWRVSNLERNNSLTYEDIEEHVLDGRQPAAPTGLSATASNFIDANGNAKAIVSLNWNPVTTATAADGGLGIDVRGYQIGKRSAEQVNPEWTWTENTTSTAIDLPTPFDANTSWEFTVRAISKTGVYGAEAVPVDLDITDDAIAPQTPSQALIEYDRGVAFAVWDGKTSSDTDMPVDFDHVRVCVTLDSTVPADDAPHVTTLRGPGRAILPLTPYDVPRYVWLQSVDRSGNAAGWSVGAEFTTSKVDAPDINAGAIQAQHLDSVIILTSQLTAGDVDGQAVEINENGIFFHTVETADNHPNYGNRKPYPMMSHDILGDQAVSITDGYSPDAIAGISQDGTVSGTMASFSEDPILNGQILMGAWSNRFWDGSGDRDSILWELPWGVIVAGDIGTAVNSGSYLDNVTNGRIPLAYLQIPVFQGRQYRFHLSGSIRVDDVTNPSNARAGVEVFYTYDPTSARNPAVPTSSSNLLGRYLLPVHTSNWWDFNATWETEWADPDGVNNYMVFLRSIDCKATLYDNHSAIGTSGWNFTISDNGPMRVDHATPAAATTPKVKKYTYYFYPSSVDQQQGSFNSSFSWNGVVQNDKAIQGWNSSMSAGPYHTNVRFADKSVGGSGQVYMADAVAGATRVEASLRTTSAWSERSSARARIGWGQSDSNGPTTQVSSAPMSRGGTVNTSLGTAGSNYIKDNAAGNDICIYIGPGSGSSNVDLLGLYAMNGGSKRMRLRLDVWK